MNKHWKVYITILIQKRICVEKKLKRASGVKHITLKLSTKMVSIHILKSKTTKAFIWEIVALWFTFPSKDNKKEQCLFSNICESGHGRPYNLGIKSLLSMPFYYQPQICELFIPKQTFDFWIRKKTLKVICFLLSHCLFCQEPLK